MHRLYTYLCAIHSLPSTVKIVNKTETVRQYPEGDNVIEERELLYSFNNDVQILYSMESDNFQSDGVCQECWISYDVVNDGGYVISPPKKQFYNRCQERFWFKIQAEFD